ncbi:MAG: class IV adenylate cyclase [Acidobacteria bacterium]|nr:class IV adenylate cyclase [Acidobacteriota bacterium]
MALEIEIKLRVHDLEEVRRKLAGADARRQKDRYFEDNWLYDYESKQLRGRGCIVRLRKAGDEAQLTFKGPAQKDDRLKVREELESSISDAEVVRKILGELGLRPVFRYQKYREVFVLPGLAAPLEIMVDETPIGNYLELEGERNAVISGAKRLGFSESDFIKSTYLSLYADYCQQQKLPIGDMVFPEFERGGPDGPPTGREGA